ncbi:MAG: tRNA pseudouridine(38-40) synthase TruA [Cyclobacteriaceae bacterium]|nr:tRNA pseudouridine(38-40) synthase TruA [Cyclobacteriaceae bacterium]
MRLFVYIAYKGTNYHGWQFQNNAQSVQQEITESLQILLKNKGLSILGSGRTDAGVHARQQVFHVDVPDGTEVENLMYRLNGIMNNDIVVNHIEIVSNKAHARFDAISRSYEYHVRLKRTPFMENEYYYHRNPLDFEAMNKGAQCLLGEQDFESFSKVKTDVTNFVCLITRAEWVTEGPNAIFYISANRFLRSMVRSIVGTLLEVGEGKIEPVEVKKIIKKKDRKCAGRSVPPQGLYLCKVEYPTFKNS